MILAPFRKENTFNNSMKIWTLCTDLVGSMMNTLLTLGKSFPVLLPHENIYIPSEQEILNDSCMMQLWNMLSEGLCVLSKESLNLCQISHISLNYYRHSVSWKEPAAFLSILGPIVTQMPKNIGKATTYTSYAMNQYKIM